MHRRRYIVTGGAGFIGSNLAERLLDSGGEVHVLDDLSKGFRANVPRQCRFYKIDITDSKALFSLKIPGKVDCVFHFAAQSSGEASFADPLRDIEVNYIATYNMLRFAKLKKCRRFIYSSSMSVYGEVEKNGKGVTEDHSCSPVSYYGCNKLASEKLIRIFAGRANMDYTIFRLFNVYGPKQNMRNMKQGMVSIYLAYLVRGGPIIVKGALTRFRDFIYVDDVLEAFMRSLYCRRAYGEIFNLGRAVKTTVGQLLDIILRAYGRKDFRKWVRVRGNTAGDVTGLTADITKLKEALGWYPAVSLEEGICKTKEWLDKATVSRKD